MATLDPVTVIQATLAPVFLVSGATLFLGFVQSRLFRVVDRLRRVRKIMKSLPEDAEAMQPLVRLQALLLRRAFILRNAIITGVVTLVATVLTALLLLLPSLGGWPLRGELATVVFGAGLLAFMLSLLLGLQDTLVSVRYVADEIAADPYVEQ